MPVSLACRPPFGAVDLFAGAGGWDEGILPLGIRPLGIEWNMDACATREAAGHPTLQADIADLDPLDFDHVNLLLASPPCQAFSSAGKGKGHRDVPLILEVVKGLVYGVDRRSSVAPKLADPRSLLVVEPLRWALALWPTYIACEQVPPVLPLWEEFAEALRRFGYSCWTGLLSAEQFGVPQTRERAFLIAKCGGGAVARPPAPTHQRFVPVPKERQEETLFDAGGRGRIVAAGEENLLPWVSMADALGWGMTERPTTTVTAGSNRQGGSDPLDGGSGSRAVVEREEVGSRAYRLHRGAGMTERYGQRRDTPATSPAPTITSKARTATWSYVNGNRTNAARRGADEPAPTVHFGKALNDVRWYDRRQGRNEPGGARRMSPMRPDSEPAPTIAAQGLAKGRDRWIVSDARSEDFQREPRKSDEPAATLGSTARQWTVERPAVTVAGDPRLGSPGHRDRKGGERQYENAVPVTLEEAAILQGFRPDYPFHGSRTAKFTQVGNAVPPPLARAVVTALLDDTAQTTQHRRTK